MPRPKKLKSRKESAPEPAIAKSLDEIHATLRPRNAGATQAITLRMRSDIYDLVQKYADEASVSKNEWVVNLLHHFFSDNGHKLGPK